MPPVQASRVRLEAAQAYSAAGERDAARRMLAGLADDRTAPSAVASGAAGALVTVLIGEGKIDEAATPADGMRPQMSRGGVRPSSRGRSSLGYIRRASSTRADPPSVGTARSKASRSAGGSTLPRRPRRRGRVLQGGRPLRRDRAKRPGAPCCWPCSSRSRPTTLPALGAALLQLEHGDTTAAAGRWKAWRKPCRRRGAGRRFGCWPGGSRRRRGDPERPSGSTGRRRPEAPATAPAAELALAESDAATTADRGGGRRSSSTHPDLSCERAGAPGAAALDQARARCHGHEAPRVRPPRR